VPDLTFDKLIFFVFAVAPGFIAIQVYSLKCPTARKDLGNSLVEVITYSLINLALWIWWVQSLIRRPFDQINKFELTAAFMIVCVVSPAALSLLCYYLRTRLLHHKLGLDHPIPRGWDYFIRNHSEFWVLFHLKGGKLLGGYFGSRSFAATFPHDQEIYVEEIWRVDERGEFVEAVENTLGGVIRISECERVEFLRVTHEGTPHDAEASRPTEGTTRTVAEGDRDGDQAATTEPGPGGGGRATGVGACGSGPADPPEGRVRDGPAQTGEQPANGQVTSC
jgi:hypothetical protein